MKLSQKKVCGNCRALIAGYGRCDLGFKTERLPSVYNYNVDEFKPVDRCYKPLTYNELYDAMEIIKLNNGKYGDD